MRVLPCPRQQYLKNLFAFNGNPRKTPVSWMPCAGLYCPIDYLRPLSWETQNLHTNVLCGENSSTPERAKELWI